MKKYNNKFTACQNRIIFSCHLNDNETLFGGQALHWMDEVAYISASNFTKKNMVTTSVDKVRFLQPIKLGDQIKITGRVKNVGNVKLEVLVEIFIKTIDSNTENKAIEGIFVFSAINTKTRKPTRL